MNIFRFLSFTNNACGIMQKAQTANFKVTSGALCESLKTTKTKGRVHENNLFHHLPWDPPPPRRIVRTFPFCIFRILRNECFRQNISFQQFFASSPRKNLLTQFLHYMRLRLVISIRIMLSGTCRKCLVSKCFITCTWK